MRYQELTCSGRLPKSGTRRDELRGRLSGPTSHQMSRGSSPGSQTRPVRHLEHLGGREHLEGVEGEMFSMCRRHSFHERDFATTYRDGRLIKLFRSFISASSCSPSPSPGSYGFSVTVSTCLQFLLCTLLSLLSVYISSFHSSNR